MGHWLVEKIALLIEGHRIGLGIARNVGGARHDGVIALLRIPKELEPGPRIVRLPTRQISVGPSAAGISAPFYA